MTADQLAMNAARQRARRAHPVLTACAHCSATKRLERHHPDPSKALEIIVLCGECHRAEHKRCGTWGKRGVLEYMRVAEAIAGQIETGELRPGDKLPAEQVIAAEYGVAYSTARRAMKELRERGLIETLWGKGTFVKGRE